MEILHLTESESIQKNAIARKLRVKIMQQVGVIQISPANKTTSFDIPENVEAVIDFLLSALSDKVWDLYS
jgi:hypothetical protein